MEESKKKNRKKVKIYNILIIVSAIACVISGYFLIKYLYLDPKQNDELYDDLRNIYYSRENKEENLDELRKINSDIIGWIRIENTPVDYPVLESENYLYKNYKGEYSRYGSIFTDNSTQLDKNPQNIILHGHHMNNGSMFASICDFANLTFYKANPTFKFDTIYGKGKWKIISVFKTNTDPEQGELFNYLISDFGTKKDNFLEYIYQVRLRSIIDMPVDINEDDKIVTLSTCSYELKDFRTVVVARKVRENEDENVDVSQAKYNSKVLYPDAYYKKFGGSRPEVTNFRNALKEGKIDWYKQK